MKLIVLSDIHLMIPDEAKNDLGNHARLDAAIDRINTAYDDADLVVLAGDLADQGRNSESYQDLKAALTRLTRPWAVTLGNHDNREVFLEVFGADFAGPGGFVQSAHDVGGYRVLVLDSLEKNTQSDAPYYSDRNGHLCDTRLAWLEAQLDTAPGPVVVILHHPLWPVGIVMDDFLLRDPGPATDMLAASGKVRQVLSGHIHMTTTVWRAGIAFTTIAGNFSNSGEDFGRRENKFRREGPAQMAVVLGDGDQLTVHFDNYVDAHAAVIREAAAR